LDFEVALKEVHKLSWSGLSRPSIVQQAPSARCRSVANQIPVRRSRLDGSSGQTRGWHAV